MANTKTIYRIGPFGIASHPWLNKPDTKYNTDGVFKVHVVAGGPEAQAHKATIDSEAEAALERYWETDEGKKVAIKERPKWSVYYPYEIDTDDAGNPTGYIKFDYKQNAVIKLTDGTKKEVKVSLKDTQDKTMLRPIWGGSELRCMYAFRDVVVKANKVVGVRMDLAQVQVRKLAESTGGASFGAVEGDGYVEEAGYQGKTVDHDGAADKDTGGDY